MTLSDVRGWVRDKLQDTQFDATIIDAAINWHIYDLLSNNNIGFMEENDTLFASSGDTSMDFPDDMQTLIKEGFACLTPSLVRMDGLYREYGDFMNINPDFATRTATNVSDWTIFANAVRFGAPLAADATFNIDYIRIPTLLTEDSDEPDIPDQYQELVVLGALKRCMETNEDYGEAQQELANLEPLRTTFIHNEGRGGLKTGPTIIRTNRRNGLRDPYGAV